MKVQDLISLIDSYKVRLEKETDPEQKENLKAILSQLYILLPTAKW
jgi:hypothetical protein